jgi:hypothetical protein
MSSYVRIECETSRADRMCTALRTRFRCKGGSWSTRAGGVLGMYSSDNAPGLNFYACSGYPQSAIRVPVKEFLKALASEDLL